MVKPSYKAATDQVSAKPLRYGHLGLRGGWIASISIVSSIILSTLVGLVAGLLDPKIKLVDLGG